MGTPGDGETWCQAKREERMPERVLGDETVDRADPEAPLQFFDARQTLVDQVAGELRRRIILGQMPAGETLGEVNLATAYQVSRGTVREALMKLRAEGLLEAMPHRSHRVAAFTHSDVEEISDLFALLESHAAEIVALPLHHEIAARAAALIRRMGRLTSISADIDEFIDLDRSFHGLLVKAAGHHRLSLMWEQLSPQLGALMVRVLPRVDCDGATVLRRHQVILDRALDNDRAGLRGEIVEHYRLPREADQDV
jgi:GntR family transcriptional regulator, gluconate operon transcriptional repressor